MSECGDWCDFAPINDCPIIEKTQFEEFCESRKLITNVALMEKQRTNGRLAMRRYYHRNKEKIKEKHKKWCQENNEKLNEYRRKYYEKNKEHIREYQKEYQKKWYQKKKKLV